MPVTENLLSGIGGIFIYANDARSLAEWYTKHFGIQFAEWEKDKNFGMEFTMSDAPENTNPATIIFSIQQSGTKLPAERKEYRINFRVKNLAAVVEHLHSIGSDVFKQQNSEYGNFAWVKDPEGNTLELYQPV